MKELSLRINQILIEQGVIEFRYVYRNKLIVSFKDAHYALCIIEIIFIR